MNNIINTITTAIYMVIENFKTTDYILTGIFAFFICSALLFFIETKYQHIRLISESAIIYLILVLSVSFIFYLFIYDAGKRGVYYSQANDFFRFNDITGSPLTVLQYYRSYPEVFAFVLIYASASAVLVISLLAVTVWSKIGRTVKNLIGMTLCAVLIIICPAVMSMSFTTDNIEYSTDQVKAGRVTRYLQNEVGNKSVLVPMRTYNALLRTGSKNDLYVMNNEHMMAECINQCNNDSINYFLFDTDNKDYKEADALKNYPIKKVGHIDRYVLFEYAVSKDTNAK